MPSPLSCCSQLPEVPGQYKFEVVALGGPTNVTSLTRSDVVTVGKPPVMSTRKCGSIYTGKYSGTGHLVMHACGYKPTCSLHVQPAPLQPATELAAATWHGSFNNCRAASLLAGVPPTPSITASSGGQSSATITWSASPTTAYYLVELLSQGVVKKSARVEHRCAVAIEESPGCA